MHTATFIAGIASTPVTGATQPVVINAAGKLGVAPATSAGSESLSAADGEHLLRLVERQQRQIERLRKEVRSTR